MRRITLIFFLGWFLSPSLAIGQPAYLDSLWSVWNDPSKPDSNRLTSIMYFVWDGYIDSDPDSAMYFTNLMYKQAEISNSKSWMATSLYIMGIAAKEMGDYSSSLAFCRQCLALSDEIEKPTISLRCLNVLGNIYKAKGDYLNAIQALTKSLSISEEIGNRQGVSTALSSIGLIYSGQGDYAESIDYHMKSLSISMELKDSSGIASDYNNLGIALKNLGKYEEAIDHYKLSLKIKTDLGDQPGIASALNNIGSVYEKMSQFDSAMLFYERSLELKKVFGNKIKIAFTQINIANTLLQKIKHDLNRSVADERIGVIIRTATQALQSGKSSGHMIIKKDASNVLYKAYKLSGDDKKALEIFEQYAVLKDSIQSDENRKGIIRQEYKWRFEAQQDSISLVRREEQIQYEADINQRKTIQIATLGVLMLLLILLYVTYRYYKSKQKANVSLNEKNNQLETLNQEKNKLIGMVAHDLRSPLNSVKGLVNITKIEKDESEKERFMELITQSTDRMTDMVNRILDVSALESKTINLKTEKIDLVELVNQLAINFRINAERKKQKIILELMCEAAKVEIDKNYFIQVLENLVSNAIKYSEPASEIKILIEQDESDVRIAVEDQGQGISVNEQKNLFKEFATLSSKTTGGEKATGLGLSIVKKYVEAMSGKIWCESELGVGTRFVLQFVMIGKS